MTFGKPLIEVGSNLFELIEFTVSGRPFDRPGVLGTTTKEERPSVFAVNVAKVREVIRLPDITPCLTTSPEVLGVFNLRGIPIPAIHLAAALGSQNEPIGPGSQVIVTEFSRRVAGFVVHGARRIRRVSWDKVLPPSSEAFSAITGMMLVENGEFVFILDFERILLDIEKPRDPHGGMRPPDVHVHLPAGFAQGLAPNAAAAPGGSGGKKPLVLVVDDSATARRALTDFLRSLEVDVLEFGNGEIAWEYLEQETPPHGTVLVSDVEMPRMDGYSLVKRVRESPKESVRGMSVIMHSSLTGEANRDRAIKVGANAYVSKFNRNEILDALRAALPHLRDKTPAKAAG